MSDAAMAKDTRYPGELSEFDKVIIGPPVQLRIPVANNVETLAYLRQLRRATERAIYILENARIKEDRTALFEVRGLYRQVAMSMSKVKRWRA